MVVEPGAQGVDPGFRVCTAACVLLLRIGEIPDDAPHLGREVFRHGLEVAARAFFTLSDEHLDVSPERIEPFVDPCEPFVDPCEPLVHPCEPFVDPDEALVHARELRVHVPLQVGYLHGDDDASIVARCCGRRVVDGVQGRRSCGRPRRRNACPGDAASCAPRRAGVPASGSCIGGGFESVRCQVAQDPVEALEVGPQSRTQPHCHGSQLREPIRVEAYAVGVSEEVTEAEEPAEVVP